MKRILLGLTCALCFAAFNTAVVRAEEKPADAGTTPAKKEMHKKKKKKAEEEKAPAAAPTTK